ncbi:MAG: hypothetical protein AAF490_07655 [Chloroflexota bacterium]
MAYSFNASRGLTRVFRIGLYGFLFSLIVLLGLTVTSSSALTTENSQETRILQTRNVFPVPVVRSASKLVHQVIPTFSIVAVDAGKTVTIRTQNYPANQDFTVMMGPMHSQGINGTVVGTFNSGEGGSFEKNFDIPEALKDAPQVSIRAQTAHVYPYYSFNWFHNVAAPEPDPEPEPDPDNSGSTGNGDSDSSPLPVYTGVPTFKVCRVTQNSSITITTSNLPPNQTFTVRMNAFGTGGIGGTVASTFESGDGGAFNVDADIPASLNGHGRIAVRIETAHANPFYAYNWFYNNTASVC